MLHWLRSPLSSEVTDILSELLHSQFWPEAQIRHYQWDKLKKLISHAYDNVPYYKALFKKKGITPGDIQNIDDVKLLPILSKQDIQNSLDDMVASNVDKCKLALNSTGGSTGMPLNFYQDHDYKKWADAARLRAWRYVPGCDLSSVEAVLWGAIRDVGKGFLYRRAFREVLRGGVLRLNTFDLDEVALKKYLLLFDLFKPPLVRGYATSLYFLAEYIEDNNIKIHRPKAIVSSTEVLHQRMRDKIETVLKAPVFDSYGCREVSQIAMECHEHNGFHVAFENQYVELIDQNIIVTNLNNYAMPFIRYKLGDMAQDLIREPCRCGRHSPRLVNLLGRDNDNIKLPNGKIINGEFFEFLFFGMSDVVQYQVVYHKKEQIMRIKIHLKNSKTDPGQTIRQYMEKNFDFSNIEINYTANFDKTPTGKLRFVYMVD
jgi:phenylacetate-CoA ligase